MKSLAVAIGCVLFIAVVVTAVSVGVWCWTWPDIDSATIEASPCPAGSHEDVKPRRIAEASDVAPLRGGIAPRRVMAESQNGVQSKNSVAAYDMALPSEDQALVEWDALVDEIGALTDHAVTREDWARVNQALRRVPPERRRESAQALLNMVSDDNFDVVHDLLLDRSQSPDVVQAVYHDLLNRPDEVKLPLLKEVANSSTHANSLEARQILELQMDGNQQ